MNRIQAEFSAYWDKVTNIVFYEIVQISGNSSFADKMSGRQKKEISACIKETIHRTFFDSKLRPEATVWFEDLRKAFPEEAARLEKNIKGCDIESKDNVDIIAVVAALVAVVGALIKKKKPCTSAVMVLGGVAASGYKIITGSFTDMWALQNEVKKQFELWKASLLKILESCYDNTDPIRTEEE